MMRRPRRTLLLVGGLVTIGAVVALWLRSDRSSAPELPSLPTVELVGADPAVEAQLEEARREIEREPLAADANGRLGMLYEIYRNPEAAAVCYRRASLLAPRDFRWHYYLGRIERELGAGEEAIASLDRALEIDPGYLPARIALGEIHLGLERLDAAEQAFRRAVETSPRSCSAPLGLGRVLAARGEHRAALESYRQALEIAPDHAPLHYALAISLRAVGESERAGEHFEIASRGGAANPDPDPLVAALFRQETGVDADYRRAKALIDSRRYAEAAALLQSVVAGDPEHFGAWGALGHTLLQTGRHQQASAAYEKAVTLNPSNTDFLRPYSLLLIRARRFEEAEALLRRVLELGGDHYDDHYLLGVALYSLDRLREASRELELALERKPDHAQAHEALVTVLWKELFRAQTSAEAIPLLNRLLEVEPRDLRGLTLLASHLAARGDLRGAIETYDRALAVNPDMPEVVRRRDELRSTLEGT